MAKIAEFTKTRGPIAVAIYNEDGSTHTHFAPTRYRAIELAKGLGAVDIQEVACSKLFPNLPAGTSQSGQSSGSGSGQQRKSGRRKNRGPSATASRSQPSGQS